MVVLVGLNALTMTDSQLPEFLLVGLNALTMTDSQLPESLRTTHSISLSQTGELRRGSQNMGRIDNLRLPLSYPVLPYLSPLIDSLRMDPQPCNRTLEILGEYNPDLNSAYYSAYLRISMRLIGFLGACIQNYDSLMQRLGFRRSYIPVNLEQEIF